MKVTQKKPDENRFDNIIDRFPDPEAVKAALLARKKHNDPYPEGFREMVMDLYYNRFNGDRPQTSRYTGVPAMTIRGWVFQDQKDEGREKPIDQFLPEQARYVIPRLKQSMIQAIEGIPAKLKNASLSETLRMLPQVAKLVHQLEAGEMPHDFTDETGRLKHRKAPKFGTTAATLMPDLEPEPEMDVDEVLRKAEAKLSESPAN